MERESYSSLFSGSSQLKLQEKSSELAWGNGKSGLDIFVQLIIGMARLEDKQSDWQIFKWKSIENSKHFYFFMLFFFLIPLKLQHCSGEYRCFNQISVDLKGQRHQRTKKHKKTLQISVFSSTYSQSILSSLVYLSKLNSIVIPLNSILQFSNTPFPIQFHLFSGISIFIIQFYFFIVFHQKRSIIKSKIVIRKYKINKIQVKIPYYPTKSHKQVTPNACAQIKTCQDLNSNNQNLNFNSWQQMNNSAFVQKAIRLVSVTEDGKYEIDPQGASFLTQIEKPLGVVSVAGLYRTGKSYLLNRMLLNKSSGFGVGNTINACTKGLWCWGTPIKGTTPDGEKINVIIIDSEGIGALDEDQNHDTKIFTLAVLSASTFIYNSVGSIDQNALQNLSLVVNLSKNIQINAHSEEEDVDPEELSQYFPSFCWVVRDFSLQLINGNGDTITPGEYLQRALALQKGFSDDIEDKNRIRRLLTSFFKQRDCITLVRPLVNQSKLQQLQKLQLQELRPQFVEQVLQLRKKILHRLTPKKFKNQSLDGKMYLNVMRSYVRAINEGAVPNMENAWSYMCQEKCYHTLEECMNVLERELREIEDSLPVEAEKMNQMCDEIEEEVLKKYFEETKGMEKQGQELLGELKQKVKTMVRDTKKQNEKESLTLLKSYAFKNFQFIDKMMGAKEFANYQEYIKELNNFYVSLIESGPNYPNKELIFLDFIKKAAVQGADHFLRILTKQYESKKTLWEEEKAHMTKRAEDLRVDLMKEIAMKKEQLRQVDEENTDLLGTLESTKEQLEKLKLKQAEVQQHSARQLKQRKQQYEAQTQELLSQITTLKQTMSSIEKQKYELEKQFQKSTALHELKQQQYMEQISEYKRKEASSVGDMMKFKTQTQDKYEKMLAEVEGKMQDYKRKYEGEFSKCEEMRERIEAMEQEIEELETLNQNLQQSSAKESTKIKELHNVKIAKLQDHIQTLQAQLEEQKLSYTELHQKFTQIHHQSSKTSSELQEKLLHQSAEIKKEKAVYQQKITFLQMELKELEETHTNNVQFYEGRIQELEKTHREMDQKFGEEKVREVQREITEKFKVMEKTVLQQRHQMVSQVENIRQERSQLGFELEMERKSKETEIAKYNKIIETIEQQLTTSRHSKQQLQQKITEEHQRKVGALQYRIKELEMELDNYKQEQDSYHQQRATKSQEAIMQLKNYYQLEKEKLEQKLVKEKEKYQKKMADMSEEWEEKIKEEIANYEEEMLFIKEDAQQVEAELRDTLQQVQHDYDLKAKSYENLQQQFTQQKVSYEKKQIELNQKIEFLTQQLAELSDSLHKKIEELSKDKNKLEKQAITLTHQKEELASAAKAKYERLTILEQQLAEITKELERTRTDFRSKESELQNDLKEKMITYETKIALNKQENQFLLKKQQQIEKFAEAKSKTYEEKIQALKHELQNGLKVSDQKRLKELTELQEKYQRLKKSAKQSQSIYSKKISSLQRDLAIEQQKCTNLETRLSEHKSSNISLEEKLSSEIQVLKSKFADEKSQLSTKLETLKQTISQLETQRQSQNSEYEKQVILKQNKIKYLEENKQKNRKQTAEKIKKFEELLAKSDKQRKEEKANAENLMSEQIKKMERKYQEELKEIQANYQKRQNEWEQKTKNLQSENRKLSQKFASSNQFNSETYILQERKLNELLQTQKRLTKELDALKNSSKMHSNDTFMLYEKEKQMMKNKLQEKEEKLRQAEKQKQDSMFELEKEKARANLEKESLAVKVEQLKETISKYERDLQKYQRENEKLKVQKRQSVNKVQLSRYSVNKSHFGANHMTERSGLEDSTSFLNVSVTSSIRGETTQRDGRSFSKMGKEYLKGYQQKFLESKENSEKHSEKNSEKGKDKENFNPILDEESFFGNYT